MNALIVIQEHLIMKKAVPVALLANQVQFLPVESVLPVYPERVHRLGV